MPRTHIPATSTHAIRNPGKTVQQVHRRPTASGAAKATASLKKEEARLQRRAYEQDIEAFNEHRDREIARITEKYGKTNRYVRALKAKAAGEQKSLDNYHNDLQDEIDDSAVFNEENLGKVEYNRLMDQLEEKRQTETRGSRATNKAAANDVRKTSMSIGKQLTNLYEHTGVRTFTIFSRGNTDDNALPQAVDSDNVLEFFLQEMGTDQLDCGNGGLAQDVAVERAGNMNTETVRHILRMILAGEIRWVSMSKEAWAALIKEQDTQRAESVGTLLKRKKRSDKGTLSVQGVALLSPFSPPSPSVIDRNVSCTPSTTNTPLTPSTVTATTTATDTMPAPTPDLDLTNLLHMPEDGLGPGLDFSLDFLGISNDMAAAFPSIVGMEPFALGHYGDAGGPSGTVYAPDLGLPLLPRPPISPTRSVLTPLDVNTSSKRTAADLEEGNSGTLAKKQHKKCSDTGIARGPRK
ncbi:hypothetical protein B0H14DRAFT_3520404 [Mycena olivaceomarginata]|nr:hypothetical protein B0H14DRAFT_3520404 [Mycena olivaceomarginata]